MANRIGASLRRVWDAVSLRKSLPSRDDPPARKPYYTLVDAVLLHLLAVTPDVYWLIPYGHENYGKKFLFPILIDGYAAYIQGLCYAELASIHPSNGGMYKYVYNIFGELLAFLTAWTDIMSHSLRAIFYTANIGGYLDFHLFDCKVTKFMKELIRINCSYSYIFPLKDTIELMNILPWPIIAGLSILAIKYTKRIINVMGVFHILTIFVTFFILWFIMDFSKFSRRNTVRDFSFIIIGPITANLMYYLNDINLFMGLDTVNSCQTIPNAILYGMLWTMLIYCIFGVLYDADMTHHELTRMNMGFTIEKAGLKHFEAVFLVPFISIMVMSAYLSIFVIMRLLNSMAEDGFIFKQAETVGNKKRTAVLATIICVVLGILSTIINTNGDDLSANFHFTFLITRSIFLLAHVTNRYKCEVEADEETAIEQPRWILINFPKITSPTKLTEKLSILLIFSTMLSITLMFTILEALRYEYNVIVQVTLRTFCILLFIFSVLLLIFLKRQPQNKPQALHMVRDVPFTVFLCLVWYAYMATTIATICILKAIFWAIAGLIVYFAFIYSRSAEFKKKVEEERRKTEELET